MYPTLRTQAHDQQALHFNVQMSQTRERALQRVERAMRSAAALPVLRQELQDILNTLHVIEEQITRHDMEQRELLVSRTYEDEIDSE